MNKVRRISDLFLPLAVLFCVYSAGCSDCTEKTQFTFNWPVPSKATVEMKADDGRDVFHTKFTISTTEGINADELLITISEFQFLRLGDADLDDPAVLAEMAPLMAMTAAIPPMVISKEGKFVRFHEWERMIDGLEDFFHQMDPTMDEEVIEHIVSMMKNPATLEQMQAASAQDWSLWVGSWVNAQLCRGESRQFTVATEMPWGGETDASAELTYLPEDSNNPDTHRLQFKRVSSGPKMREALIESMKKLIPPDQLNEDKIAEMQASIGDCYLSFEATVTTDPSTLMPSTISSSKIIKISNPKDRTGGEQQIDNREYTFTWE